jgi:hypothetical protein
MTVHRLKTQYWVRQVQNEKFGRKTGLLNEEARGRKLSWSTAIQFHEGTEETHIKSHQNIRSVGVDSCNSKHQISKIHSNWKLTPWHLSENIYPTYDHNSAAVRRQRFYTVTGPGLLYYVSSYWKPLQRRQHLWPLWYVGCVSMSKYTDQRPEAGTTRYSLNSNLSAQVCRVYVSSFSNFISLISCYPKTT